MNQTILEIRSQYEALRKTLSLFEEKRASLARIWAEKKPKALAFIGCGSSYMVSCSLRDAAAKAWWQVWLAACRRKMKVLTRRTR